MQGHGKGHKQGLGAEDNEEAKQSLRAGSNWVAKKELQDKNRLT